MCTAMKELLHKLCTWKAVMKMNSNGWLSELVKITSNCQCSLLCELQSRGFSVHTLELFHLCYILWQLRKQLQMLKSAMFYFWGTGKTLTLNVALKVS